MCRNLGQLIQDKYRTKTGYALKWAELLKINNQRVSILIGINVELQADRPKLKLKEKTQGERLRVSLTPEHFVLFFRLLTSCHNRHPDSLPCQVAHDALGVVFAES